MTNDLRLDDDAAALIPGAGGIAGLAIEMGGLARFARQTSGRTHQARCAALKNLVFPHRDDVLEPLALEEGEHLGGGEAAVQAYPQPCAREGRSQPRQQPRQDPDRTNPGAGIAGAQHVGEQVLIRLLVEGQEPGHRQIAPGVVVAVEKSQLLGAVRRIVGGVQIDRNPLGLALQAPIDDRRQSGKVRHAIGDLVRQRLYAIACGYPDGNDAGRLGADSLQKLLCGRDSVKGEDLASQPTLPRFENAFDRADLYRMSVALADTVIERPEKTQRP